ADPQSAILFLLLVPGVAAALFGLARAALAAQQPGPTFQHWLAVFWLSRALGILALAPGLLVTCTNYLVRKRIAIPERRDANLAVSLTHDFGRCDLGDWLEILGLAAGASFMGLLLAMTQGRRELAGWQLWGAPQLLIFWASFRQGLMGGAIVAGTAVAVPLLVLSNGQYTWDAFTLLLQGNLLAQCSTGMLVAASASSMRASEERFRSAVSHTPVVMYSARLERSENGEMPAAELTLVSAATSSILGCPADQLLGDFHNWLMLVHPEDRVVLQAAVAQLERQQQPVTCEYRLGAGARDGVWDPGSSPPRLSSARDSRVLPRRPVTRWVRDTLAPRYDAHGKVVGWEGVVVDITEQRALSDDLRRTTSMFHALVANLPAGVFFVHGQRGRPILVNTRARQLLGQREDAWTGLEQL